MELDVRISRDGVPVVFHDPVLDRTTNGKGPLAALTFDEIRGLNAAARYQSGRLAPQPVPALEEVLDRFREIPLIIEVKETAAVQATEQMIRRFAAESRVLVGSTRDAVMERLYATGLACCASTTDAMRLLPSALTGGRARAGRFQVLSLTPRYFGVPIPIKRLAALARAMGVPTHVWTVNDPAEAIRYWQHGVTAVLTDDPVAMLRVRPK
jgi:glycerophosphoryl diester phosphodiesterase